jgi:hypothetical protein
VRGSLLARGPPTVNRAGALSDTDGGESRRNSLSKTSTKRWLMLFRIERITRGLISSLRGSRYLPPVEIIDIVVGDEGMAAIDAIDDEEAVGEGGLEVMEEEMEEELTWLFMTTLFTTVREVVVVVVVVSVGPTVLV